MPFVNKKSTNNGQGREETDICGARFTVSGRQVDQMLYFHDIGNFSISRYKVGQPSIIFKIGNRNHNQTKYKKTRFYSKN